MKKLQRRQQQNNTNETHEKKSKKKHTNNSLSNHYIFDEEGENIGKILHLFHQKEIASLSRVEDSRYSSEQSMPHSISNDFGSSNDENNKHDLGERARER